MGVEESQKFANELYEIAPSLWTVIKFFLTCHMIWVIAITIIIGIAIYKTHKLNAKVQQLENQIKILKNHTNIERWKQDKGGFIDLDAKISLPWRRAT